MVASFSWYLWHENFNFHNSLFTFSFCHLCFFVVISKNHCLNWDHEDLFLCFLLALTFRLKSILVKFCVWWKKLVYFHSLACEYQLSQHCLLKRLFFASWIFLKLLSVEHEFEGLFGLSFNYIHLCNLSLCQHLSVLITVASPNNTPLKWSLHQCCMKWFWGETKVEPRRMINKWLQ